jgi:hypothetical protein
LRDLPELSLDPPKSVIERRIWRDWAPSERTSLAKAYRRLIGEAKDAAKRNQGLLHAAWWHGHFCCDHPGDDIPPNEASTDDIHHTWAFLPWHRAFIYLHERLLARHLGDDFRLPVWQWENDAEVPELYQDLPAPFVTGPRRKRSLALPFSECYLRAWLVTKRFEDFAGSGGPGQAEAGAHGAVHASLGGAMANLAVAAADPLFFSHHANVDRFWWHWSTQLKLRVPDQFRQEYVYFYDLTGRLGKIKIANLLEPAALGYKYDPPAVKLTGLAPVNLLTALPSVLSNLPALIAEVPADFARLYALSLQFLAALPQDILRAKVASHDRLSQQNLLATLRDAFSTADVSVSLQAFIHSAGAMKNYPVSAVALQHPTTAKLNVTIGEVYSNGQMTMPPCVPVTSCLDGSLVVPLIELLVSTGGMPQVIWGKGTLNPGGTIAIAIGDSHNTTFCNPLQILNYQDSLAYLFGLL